MRQSQHDVTLEAAGGHYDYEPYALEALDISALRARVTIGKIERVSNWLPTFGFVLANGTSALGFHVRCERYTAPRAGLFLTVDGKEIKSVIFAKSPTLGQPFSMEMSWTKDGHVIATLKLQGEAERLEFDLGARPKELRVTVSGGRFEVAPLELGHLQNAAN